MMHIDRGLLISIEGGDGSGKSSALSYACGRLKDEGYEFLLTREPGGNRISEKIRSLILDKENTDENPKTEALLYAASRCQLMNQDIFPLLDAGKIVLTDRYVDSSLAYQGYGRNLGADEILSINMFAIDGRLPDWTLFFDVRPEVGLARIRKNREDKVDRLDAEKLEFHQRVYKGYQELEKRFADRFVRIDGEKSPEEVRLETYAVLKEKLDAFLAGKK